ncbi:MAG: tetratricopeptide repeat protein [bacterium]
MLFGSRKDKSTELVWNGDSVFTFDLVPADDLYTRLSGTLKVVPRYIARDIPGITGINPTELIGKRLVFIGRSSSGKTREAIELIRKINSCQRQNIYVLRTCLTVPIEFPEGLPTSNLVILIDDLPRLPSTAASESISEWRQKLPPLIDRLRSTIVWFEKRSSTPITVIITIRDDEFKPLIDKAITRWFKDHFLEINLPNLTETQNAEAMDNLCDALEIPKVDDRLRAQFAHDGDGTFDRYAQFFSRRSRGAKIVDMDYQEFTQNKDMFWHWIHLRLKNEERAIFRVLSLFRFYNIPAFKPLVVNWSLNHIPECKGMKPQQLELVVDCLARQYFNLWENRINCHDSRLKFEPAPFARELEPISQFMIQSIASDKSIRPILLGALVELGEAAYFRHLYDLAQQIFTTILKYHPKHPLVNLDLAMVHCALGAHHKKKYQAELKTAINLCETALNTYTEQLFPYEYSQTQYILSLLYTDLPSGNNEENLRVAVVCCKNALQYFTRNEFPDRYGAIQTQLGVIHQQLTHPTRDENIASAIDYFGEALSIFTQGIFSEAFAFSSMKLGEAYYELKLGNKPDNLKFAMDNYFAALLVATRQAYPLDHVHLQVLLGKAYLDLPTGEIKENVGQALDCFREALTVYVPTEQSGEYANAQYLMGIGFTKLPGDKVRNLQAAIEFFKNSLKLYTKSTFPTEHLLATGALTSAEMELERIKH